MAAAGAPEPAVAAALSVGAGAMGALGGPECTPGYYNNEGQPNPSSLRSAPYGAGSIEFFKLLEKWRSDGSFAGLEFEN